MFDKIASLRPETRKLAEAAKAISETLADICDHHEPETCPACFLYAQISEMEGAIGKLCIDMDYCLERQQVPNSEEPKS